MIFRNVYRSHFGRQNKGSSTEWPRNAGAVLVPALCIAGCGGGSSSQAPPTAALSSDQQIYQQVELGGGESTLSWSFPIGGGTLVSGTNYIFATTTALSHSPANGPQTQTLALNSLSSSLVIPNSVQTPTRVLRGGQVLVAPANASQLISYSGTGIRRDRYAQDGVTVIASALFFNYTSSPLSGSMTDSPAELLAAVPFENWVILNVFTGGMSWQPGSAYIKSSGQRIGDTVYVADCTGSTTTADINSCTSGTTLDNFFPYTFVNTYPVETDFAGDGSISTIQGVTMWVSASPLPLQVSSTLQYRVFYELNGNVYTGTLEKDGTPFNYGEGSGNVVGYQITLNQAALNSVIAGLITNGAPGTDLGSSGAVPSIDLFGLGGHGVNGTMAPVDLQAHYNIPSTLNGSGQTIAIIDELGGGNIQNDLNVFSAYYGLPQCNDSNPCFRQIDLSNGATVAPGGSEVALDTQMVHAIAPGANIVLVIANSASEADTMAAVQAAASVSGVTAVSMSFGFPETADEQTAYDPIFAQHPGVIFFAASGDSGAYSPRPAVLLPFGGSYPAASPYVTAIGGTRWQSIAWTGPTSEVAWQFSGGGASLFEPMPAWQTTYLSGSPLLMPNNGMRAIPDVSALADGVHSAFGIYQDLHWQSAGGTSAATPLWAGIAALLGQKMANEGKSLSALVQATAGGFNGLIYQTQLTQGTAAGFYPVNSGSNNLTVSPCSLCTAGPGYSDVTGLGAPNVTEMLSHF
jgi:hypothetical protein